MKVYAVTSGYMYDDYTWVQKLFKKKSNAEAYVKKSESEEEDGFPLCWYALEEMELI